MGFVYASFKLILYPGSFTYYINLAVDKDIMKSILVLISSCYFLFDNFDYYIN